MLPWYGIPETILFHRLSRVFYRPRKIKVTPEFVNSLDPALKVK